MKSKKYYSSILCKLIIQLKIFICSWFFGKISRKEAEKLLLSEENQRGTYLVRDSEHNPNGFSLSVKDWEGGRGYHVKHYKIKSLDNGGFYIATNQTFSSLPELISAYSSKYFNIFLLLFKLCYLLIVIFRKFIGVMSCFGSPLL